MAFEDSTSLRRDHKSQAKPAIGGDLIIPVLAVAFTTYYLLSTANLTWEAKANGVVIGIMLYALIAMQAVRIAMKVARGQATLGFGELVEFSKAQWQRIGIVAILIVFIAAIGVLGTSLSLFLTVFALMWVLDERRWSNLLGISFATTATVYLLFIVFLGTRLPRGPVENAITFLTGGF
jgi:hypothetical protein